MAKILSIRPKTCSFENLVSKVSLEAATYNVPATYVVDKESSQFEGVCFPCDIRVRTTDGIKNTNGVFFTWSSTIKITLASGAVVEATPSHKLFSRDWIAMRDIEIGTELSTETGTDVVVKVEEGATQPVADICVPGPHSYMLDNGIVSHNSLVANQLNINQSSLGYKTTMVPLEMATSEQISRTMSNISGYSSIDIFLKRLASGERDEVYKKMRRFDRKVANAGGRYTIYKPKEDLTIEELMASLHNYSSDVIYIDYVTLLKGADGEDQWRKLGQIARFGKIYAENYNRVVVLLAQINEEGKLRYSQSVKEHSSLAWTAVATKESKEKGYLNFEMLKARNQVMKPFTLGIDYSKMSVYDLKPEDQEALDQERQTKSGSGKDSGDGKRKGKGKDGKRDNSAGGSGREGKSSDYAPDLSED